MRIIGTQYSLVNRSLELYTAGCKAPHCEGCFSQNTWEFEQGDVWDRTLFSKIQNKIDSFISIINNIMIFGGEPLDNPEEEVISFLEDLLTLKLPIWLFTKRDFNDVPSSIKSRCSFIKCGKYDSHLISDSHIMFGIKLASTNQIIYKIGDGRYK